MRALRLTNATRPGGRPRESHAPRNAFADWLDTLDLKPEQIVARIRAMGVPVSSSSIYNARNGWFTPGRRLANAIARLSTDQEGKIAVPATSWDDVPRRKRSRAPATKAGKGKSSGARQAKAKPKKRAKAATEVA